MKLLLVDTKDSESQVKLFRALSNLHRCSVDHTTHGIIDIYTWSFLEVGYPGR